MAAVEVREEDEKKSALCCSWRLGLALLAFIGFTNSYCQRVGMSVAIVCMTNRTALKLLREDAAPNVSMMSNTTYIPDIADDQCGANTGVNGSDTSSFDGPFVYTKNIQGQILGSFFYGYLVSQIPGGMLAERFGGKVVFAGFFGLSTVATFLTPIAAQAHIGFLIFVRILAGVGSGALFPCMHAVWGHWAPPMERSMLVSIACAGAFFGNVVALPLSGVMCQGGFMGGWPSIFYIFGITSAIWFFAWLFLASDSPAKHRFISDDEKSFINRSLQGQISTDNTKDLVPWKSVLTSMPVWAIVVGNFCTDWGLYTMLTNIPTYMAEVLQFDIASNGMFSALPFIGLYVCMNFASFLADFLRSRKILTTTMTRKLFQCGGCVIAAVFVIILGFMRCDQANSAVAVLTMGVTITGFTYSGWLPNHMDIAPKFAGTLYGLSNCIGSISGFIAPAIAAGLTTNADRESWQKVFYICAAVYIAGAIFYAIFGSGELQSWAAENVVAEEEYLKEGEDKEMTTFDKNSRKPEKV